MQIDIENVHIDILEKNSTFGGMVFIFDDEDFREGCAIYHR